MSRDELIEILRLYGLCRADAERVVDALLVEYAIIPKMPTPGLLKSMAIRYDHGLAVPGYYDLEFFNNESGMHQQQIEAAISTMKQLHAEVVGEGFYRPELEDKYNEWLK